MLKGLRTLWAIPFLLCSRRFWHLVRMCWHSERYYYQQAHIGEPLSSDPVYVDLLKQHKHLDDEALRLALSGWRTTDEVLNNYTRVICKDGHVLYI